MCPIAKKTALAAPTLCTDYGSDGWMDGWITLLVMLHSIVFLIADVH